MSVFKKIKIDFIFYFYNPKFGGFNSTFKNVEYIINNKSTKEVLDKGTFYEKQTYRFNIRELGRNYVK